MPDLLNMYGSAENPAMAVFYLKDSTLPSLPSRKRSRFFSDKANPVSLKAA